MLTFQIYHPQKQQWDTVSFEFFLLMAKISSNISKYLSIVLFTDGAIAELHTTSGKSAEFLVAKFSSMENFQNFVIFLTSKSPDIVINLTILHGRRVEDFVMYSGMATEFIQGSTEEN